MTEYDEDGGADILARIEPNQMRRIFGLAMLFVLGGLLIWIALARPPAIFGLRLFLLAVGAGAIALTAKMHRATAQTLELTEESLRSSDGRVLARVDDIVSVDRGFAAFKPSNGFVITLATPMPRQWAPGLWWRVGRRIGVGGVVPAGQTRAMAEILSAHLAQRRASDG